VCNNFLVGSIRPIVGAGVCVINLWREASYNHHHGLLLYREREITVGAGACVITFSREARYNRHRGLLLYREIGLLLFHKYLLCYTFVTVLSVCVCVCVCLGMYMCAGMHVCMYM